MSRRTEAPAGMECPYRHACPHLDDLSTPWVLEVYHEAQELREQLHAMEQRYQQRIAELEKTLLERDAKIAQLQLQHRKRFKANAKPPPTGRKGRRRGAPVGHPAWRRREPDHIDEVVQVPAPKVCPHCQCDDLSPHGEVYQHDQEDIVLVPRTRVVRFVHRQCFCPHCRRAVYQPAEGELPGCQIGPVTRAVAMHLRYDLQIPYRKVQHVLSDLFGMPLVPATAMNFDRKATALARPLYEELAVILKSSRVVYADETSWREDGQSGYVWFGGNDDVAVYLITSDRSADSAVKLLGREFDGTLVSDDYAAYNAVDASHQQTCWNHIRTRAKEIAQQIELTEPPIRAPRSLQFCGEVQRLALRCCALGRQIRRGELSLGEAGKMIPRLRKQLQRITSRKLDHEAAETLRLRLLEKDRDKLFTFLRVKGVEPTNNHSEQSLRFLVIMRKVSFGTRSEAGSESHSVLPSLLQTARRQGKNVIDLLVTLLTRPLDAARRALFARRRRPPPASPMQRRPTPRVRRE
jgi:transposase